MSNVSYNEFQELKQQVARLKQRCCCINGLPVTEGAPTGEPSNNQNVMIDPATGTIYYWNGTVWVTYISDIPPINATDIADGTVTNTEFQYINTVTSNVQNQLNNKSNLGHTHTTVEISDIAIGTYNPGLAAISNILDASLVGSAYYFRVGNFIIVHGALTIETNTTLNPASFAFDLPFASSGALAEEAVSGMAVTDDTASEVIRIKGDGLNASSVLFNWIPIDGSEHNWSFYFSYYIS